MGIGSYSKLFSNIQIFLDAYGKSSNVVVVRVSVVRTLLSICTRTRTKLIVGGPFYTKNAVF